ncbi:MAG: ABC transporter substrate-binding protein, partial [Jaaginema sp. PMC 1079.18]|nr:ABC transporter substrate-binding protein [Jaaginema sp. PMC 1079.18]
ANRAQVPVLGPSNTAQGVPQIGKYIGRVSAPVAVVAPNAVAEALKINPDIQKVAVLFAQNDAFSKSETETFQATVKEQGLELTTVQKFQTTDTDFQSQATAAINTKPDLIIISGLAADGGNLVKQLRELGYEGLIIGGNGLNTSNVFPVCQDKCDGILIAQAYSPELDNDINQAFREAYKAENNSEPPQFSAQAFTGIQVFVEALRAIDSETPLEELSLAELRDKLRDEVFAGSYETVLGDLAFTSEGEIEQEQFYVAQIKMDADGKKGEFAFLK